MVEARIDLLGRFDVSVDGRGVPAGAWVRRSASALVKVLSLAPGRSLHREQVLDCLWPGLAPEAARPRLHTATHYARRALGHRSAVVLHGDVLSLLPDAEVEVDVALFRRLAQVALRSRTATDVDAAIAVHTGELLPEDLFEPWTESERDSVRRLYVDVLRAGRQWDDVLRWEPADEQAHLELMRAAVAHGDRHGALRQFERLEQALAGELGISPGPEAVALRRQVLHPPREERAPDALPRLLARRPVLERLDRALEQARGGRGGTALINGAPGAGTSSVLHWARVRAVAAGARVGAGAASAVEGGWPYGPVLEALADLCRRHPSLLDGLDPAYRQEIERALRGGELRWSGEGAHQRLFVSAAELLRLAADGTGAVLTVDDLHEADDGSLRLLHYLTRVAISEPVLLVIGAHLVPPDSRLGRMRASLVRRAAVLDLPLPPLPLQATATLLAATSGAPVEEETVREVHRLARGLPQRILELAPTVGRSGTGHLPLDLLLAECPPGTEDALRRSAVAGMAVTTDEFVAFAATDENTAFPLLEAALEVGILEPADVSHRFRNSRLRGALLADLPPHRVQRLHAEVAAALQTVHAPPARVAQHLVRAGDRTAAVPWLLRAAETSAALGAYRDALDLVEQTRGWVGPDRARMLRLRADLLLAVGDAHAVTAYREAAGVAVGDDRRAVLARLAQAASMAGDADTAAEAVAGLQPDGGPADGSILLARGLAAYFRGDIDGASAAVDEARRRIDGPSDWRLLELVTLQGLIAHDRGEWFGRLRHELHRTRQVPAVATAVFDAHLCVAEYLLYGPTPYPEVMALGRALRETAQRAGALRAVAFASALTGEAALLSGDLATAEHDLSEAVDLHTDIGAPAGQAHALQRLAELRVTQGDRAEARRLLQRAYPLARWSSMAMHLVQRIQGTTITAAETPEEAHAAAEAAEAVVAPQDHCRFCQIMISVPSAIACADVGDLDAARRHLGVAERSAALWSGTAWQGALLEARAHVARAGGDTAAARRLLVDAAGCFEGAGQPRDADRCRAAPTGSIPTPREPWSVLPSP
jgi:DNA-binding SARP family transcriptional activator/tetratricopeptide (TPR) repeat protein